MLGRQPLNKVNAKKDYKLEVSKLRKEITQLQNLRPAGGINLARNAGGTFISTTNKNIDVRFAMLQETLNYDSSCDATLYLNDPDNDTVVIGDEEDDRVTVYAPPQMRAGYSLAQNTIVTITKIHKRWYISDPSCY